MISKIDTMHDILMLFLGLVIIIAMMEFLSYCPDSFYFWIDEIIHIIAK